MSRPYMPWQGPPARVWSARRNPSQAPMPDADSLDLDLLARFAQEAGMAPPSVALLAVSDLPEAARGILVQDGGMTQALVSFWGEAMRLSVLDSTESGGTLRRAVVLSAAESGMPAELGLIEIELERLPSPVRDAVRAGLRPFGTVLAEATLPFRSRPEAFLAVTANRVLADILDVSPGEELYGRATLLRLADGTAIARAVEILSGHGPG
ncbi:hypothetical protein HHL28_06405 [Aerophototrophica crusticola]|uniref:Uncharacterized protein n=1 Tax=Aerophototrophica crusticola TaxID=1709002 RepID=A0A858R5I6_9PROT|nr:hypothetical protein HHL28_06405 [Rhodospirillaceae bacterium B3]